MNIRTLTAFFKWCTIINGSLLVLSAIMFILAPDFIYSMQNQLFPISREFFDLMMYSFLGIFKIIFLVFNVVPYVALLIVGKNGHPTRLAA